MVFCTGCGREIHETAPSCPQCGKPQKTVPTHGSHATVIEGPLWAAITSLVLGVLCVLSMFDVSNWGEDTRIGEAMFAILGLVFGIVSLNISKRGRGMAITGIVMSAIGILSAIGHS